MPSTPSSKEPLLPHHRRLRTVAASPGRSPKCIREQYLRRLGYTPLIFEVEREKQLLMTAEAHDREERNQSVVAGYVRLSLLCCESLRCVFIVI